MLKEKQGQFWNLHRIPNKTLYPNFRFFLLFCCFFQFFSGLKISNCNFIRKSSIIEENKTKIENQDTKFCSEFDADSKNVLVFLLALIVFDLFSFEGSRVHFTGETNMYIYMHILTIIRGF